MEKRGCRQCCKNLAERWGEVTLVKLTMLVLESLGRKEPQSAYSSNRKNFAKKEKPDGLRTLRNEGFELCSIVGEMPPSSLVGFNQGGRTAFTSCEVSGRGKNRSSIPLFSYAYSSEDWKKEGVAPLVFI